ncbi:DUF3597 domain-containing protein [Entomobacter blattae]|nr:DUF3597 domain-containing protein [Entomobacter blattae]
MGLFSSIMSKIFGHAEAAPVQEGTQTADSTAPSASTSGSVDVEAVLSDMATKAGQTLNWRESIVDLLKLLNLDSSLSARQQLADELHYNGDKNDSASMNIWLHKAVMKALADNGGKVPDSLKH